MKQLPLSQAKFALDSDLPIVDILLLDRFKLVSIVNFSSPLNKCKKNAFYLYMYYMMIYDIYSAL